MPAIVDGDATVFDTNAILLYLAEKTGKFLPAKSRKARGELLSWLMFVASGVGPYSGQAVHFTQLRAGEAALRDQPLRLRGAAPFGILNARLGQAQIHAGRHLHHRRHGRLGLGAAAAERARRGRLGQVPNLKRLVDEISARPAAQQAIALKDKHKFKTEMDEDALHAMFPHLKEKVA